MSNENSPTSVLVTKEAAEAIGVICNEIISTNRSARRWYKVKIWALCIVLALAGLSTAWEMHVNAKGVNISSVPITGVIGQGTASAEAVIPAIKAAFEDKNSTAVILAIDSSGGIPADAFRISQVIEIYKQKTKKPVIAIIDGVGASAAYMIAVHADKVVAGQYSLVGSIGAIIQNWDYHEIMEKVGVRQRIFASGKLKSMLNSYTEMTPDAKIKAQEIVDRMALSFINDVKVKRKGKLKEGDWFTGEVWPGNEALEIGLVDEVGSLEQYIEKNYPDGKVSVIKPSTRKSFFNMEAVARTFSETAFESLIEQISARQ